VLFPLLCQAQTRMLALPMARELLAAGGLREESTPLPLSALATAAPLGREQLGPLSSLSPLAAGRG